MLQWGGEGSQKPRICSEFLVKKCTKIQPSVYNTVNSLIEDGLLFNFWTFEAVLYSSIFQFLLNKRPNFQKKFRLLFETVFNSKQSSIKEFTVYWWYWQLLGKSSTVQKVAPNFYSKSTKSLVSSSFPPFLEFKSLN